MVTLDDVSRTDLKPDHSTTNISFTPFGYEKNMAR